MISSDVRDKTLLSVRVKFASVTRKGIGSAVTKTFESSPFRAPTFRESPWGTRGEAEISKTVLFWLQVTSSKSEK